MIQTIVSKQQGCHRLSHKKFSDSILECITFPIFFSEKLFIFPDRPVKTYMIPTVSKIDGKLNNCTLDIVSP